LAKVNLLESVLPYLDYENIEVKFKCLGVIRILLKSFNETNGLNILFEEANLERFVSIANSPNEHAGIAGESTRLVCYLPIAAKSEKNILKLSKLNIINAINVNLKSDYLIMLNEALLAINVLVTIAYSKYYALINFIINKFNIIII
jgi:hypothetical protein